MGQEIKNPDLSGKIRKKAEIPKKSSGSLTLGIFKIWTRFLVILAEKPKNKRKKYKFFTKKILSFFKKKLGSQEIKIRINPDKTGKIRKSFLGH